MSFFTSEQTNSQADSLAKYISTSFELDCDAVRQSIDAWFSGTPLPTKKKALPKAAAKAVTAVVAAVVEAAAPKAAAKKAGAKKAGAKAAAIVEQVAELLCSRTMKTPKGDRACGKTATETHNGKDYCSGCHTIVTKSAATVKAAPRDPAPKVAPAAAKAAPKAAAKAAPAAAKAAPKTVAAPKKKATTTRQKVIVVEPVPEEAEQYAGFNYESGKGIIFDPDAIGSEGVGGVPVGRFGQNDDGTFEFAGDAFELDEEHIEYLKSNGWKNFAVEDNPENDVEDAEGEGEADVDEDDVDADEVDDADEVEGEAGDDE